LYQQTGKSAKTRSTKTSADALQSSQVKKKGPKSTKSQAKRQKTSSPPAPHPGSPIHVESSPSLPEVQTQQAPSPPQPQEAPQPEETSADVLEQTVDPVSPITPSSYKQLYYPFSCIVPSATPADQPVVPSASTSQRREIALKQVSYLILILYITNIWSSNNLSPFSFQEQDSPDSLFSFAIKISDDEGEEASSSQAVGISSAKIRAKLEDLLALLHQDTAQLVDDSDPAKALFKALRGQIPADAEEILSRLHTWRAASSSTKRLPNALPTEPPMPNSQRK